MNTYLSLFIIALCSSLVLTPMMRRLAERYKLFDNPRDGRCVHRAAVPRLGGVAIFLSVFIALAVLPVIDNSITHSLITNKSQLLATLIPATLIMFFGVYDDLYGAKAGVKFLAQGLAATMFYVLGGCIQALSLPFIGSVELPMALGFVLTVLWTVGITNAFNLIDGIDGLAAGTALFASLVMLVVSLTLDHPFVTVVSIALAAALIGFLRYNFNPASIFMGDSGSLFIGFILAALSVHGTQKASTAIAVAVPLIAFGLPIIDTSLTIARRLVSGQPIFKGDREHVHHMLLARGWSQRRVVLALYGVCALFGLLSLLIVNDTGRTTGFILLIISAGIVISIGRLRYHEVDELKASMKRNLVEHRQRTINNIRIRRISHTISKATTSQELLCAVQEMLEHGEFVYAVMQLGANSGEHASSRDGGSSLMCEIGVRGGSISWSWKRDGFEAVDVIGSSRFWTLRLPLSTDRAKWGYINLYREFGKDALLFDVNYLCNFFQYEMARAAERVLSEDKGQPEVRQLAAVVASGD